MSQIGPRPDQSVNTGTSYKRLAVLAGFIASTAVVLYLLRGALFPFVVGGAIAYTVVPAANGVERIISSRRLSSSVRRMAAILITYTFVLAIAVGLLFLIVPPAIRESRTLSATLPQIIESGRETVNMWLEGRIREMPPEIETQLRRALEGLGGSLVTTGELLVNNTLGIVSRVLTVVLGLALVPVFVFYVMRDKEKIVDGLVRLFPDPSRPHARNIVLEINEVLASYVRAQLILALAVGTMVFVGLSIVGVKFTVFLSVTAGIFALVPILGPLLGAIPGLLVTLSASPEDIVWVILVYAAVQGVENSVLAPRIQGQALGLHPIVIMGVLMIGSQIAGILGIVLGAPIVAVAVRVTRYVVGQASSSLTASAEPSELPSNSTPPPDVEDSLGEAVDTT